MPIEKATNKALESYRCHSCKAEPGRPCMTLGNAPHYTQPHESRWTQWRRDVRDEASAIAELAIKPCKYSLAHYRADIPATTTIDCGPVGIVPACQDCADFYERMKTSGR